jgi:IS30 family transposase
MNRLNQDQRYQIEALIRAKIIQKEIAEIIGVTPPTISREISRNTGLRGYRGKQAHELAQARQRNIPKKVYFTKQIEEKIIPLIQKDYSPEQIVGYLGNQNELCVSHERIYQFIKEDRANGGDLHTHLRRDGKKRKKKYGKKDSRGQIKNKVSIEQRPVEVDEKIVVGHWEIDLIVSSEHKGFLVTAVERVTKFTLVGYSRNKDSKSITKVLIQLMSPYILLVKTITADNGREFAGHQEVSKALKAGFYFCHAYHSWERGLNENTNGLIRQYFPKGEIFKDTSQKRLDFVMDRLNTRPRKILEFQLPYNTFKKEFSKIALVA